MFTGLVQRTGLVSSLADGRLVVDVQPRLEISKGGSVAVNGVCLTATGDGAAGLDADVMAETLRRTALGQLRGGDRVNLELPLRLGDPLGGHIVQGHVDAVGTVESVAEEGSIAVDGVSLTVASVDDGLFSVSLIPETLDNTTLGALTPGLAVNLEVDVLAKYVEKLMP